MCAPFRLERCDFARILCCMREIKVLKHGQDYVTEKLTPVDSLSLVLSGRYFFAMPYFISVIFVNLLGYQNFFRILWHSNISVKY